MKRKDAPQLFEIMRTTLAGKMQSPAVKAKPRYPGIPPAPGDAPPVPEPPVPTAPETTPGPEAAPPAPSQARVEPPSPVSPPLILPPAEPATVPPPEPVAPAAAAPPAAPPATAVASRDEAPADAAPGPVAPPAAAIEPELEAPAAIEPPPEPTAPPPPPPPEPVFTLPPPKPKPKPRARPFTIKPPSPGLFEASPEQRVILPYPAALAATAILLTLLFAAFAIGRGGTPAAGARGAAGPVARTDAAPRWTLLLEQYDLGDARAAADVQQRIGHMRERGLRAIRPRAANGTGYVFYGEWNSPEAADIAPLMETFQQEPFNYRNPRVMRAPW